MYKVSDFTKNTYKTGEVAKLLNLTNHTIMNYDKAGKLKVNRSKTNRRIITRENLLNFLDKQGLLIHDEEKEKSDVIYARVSSQEQKTKGDLDRQALFLIEKVKDLNNPIIIKEVGSGLNDKRTKLNQLIDMVLDGKVKRVFVTYKDRLTRFGFNYLKHIFEKKQVDIIVVEDEEKQKSVHDELVEDMMSLIASFSGKIK